MFVKLICLAKYKKMKYKKIKTLDQYTDYCNTHEKLVQKNEKQYEDELELLEILIEEYDNRIMKSKFDELNPVELLKSLLRDSEISQAELAQSIDVSPQLISDILNYRRNISKDVVLKLSNYFSMTEKAFSRKYDLKIEKEGEGLRG